MTTIVDKKTTPKKQKEIYESDANPMLQVIGFKSIHSYFLKHWLTLWFQRMKFYGIASLEINSIQ